MIERIQELLAAVDDDGGLLGTDDDPEAAQPGGNEHPGMVIDRYRLERQIGEGAVGIVFEAQQLKPFRKLVALKIIKAGMDSKEVAARFDDLQRD